jgi:hypothetical protein
MQVRELKDSPFVTHSDYEASRNNYVSLQYLLITTTVMKNNSGVPAGLLNSISCQRQHNLRCEKPELKFSAIDSHICHKSHRTCNYTHLRSSVNNNGNAKLVHKSPQRSRSSGVKLFNGGVCNFFPVFLKVLCDM